MSETATRSRARWCPAPAAVPDPCECRTGPLPFDPAGRREPGHRVDVADVRGDRRPRLARSGTSARAVIGRDSPIDRSEDCGRVGRLPVVVEDHTVPTQSARAPGPLESWARRRGDGREREAGRVARTDLRDLGLPTSPMRRNRPAAMWVASAGDDCMAPFAVSLSGSCSRHRPSPRLGRGRGHPVMTSVWMSRSSKLIAAADA